MVLSQKKSLKKIPLEDVNIYLGLVSIDFIIFHNIKPTNISHFASQYFTIPLPLVSPALLISMCRDCLSATPTREHYVSVEQSHACTLYCGLFYCHYSHIIQASSSDSYPSLTQSFYSVYINLIDGFGL